MKRTREENIGILVFIGMIIILLSSKFLIDKKIEKKRAYVLGHLVKSSFEGSETGWVHDFEYSFRNKKFIRSFGSPINKAVLKDSLMFLKVSIDNPSLSFDVQNIRVPECLTIQDVPVNGWDMLPGDTICK